MQSTKLKLLGKVILAIVFAAVLTVGGFLAAILFAFAGQDEFYVPIIAVTAMVLLVFALLLLFTSVQRKKVYKSLVTYIVIATLCIGGYEAYRSYEDSIPELKDQVDLTQYQPFVPDTKVASLEGPSNFKMKGEVPKLDGATALYPIYSAFVQATYPEDNYDPYGKSNGVSCTTTPNAYSRLINGEVDMIFVAEPSQAQMEEAAKKGVKLNITPIGKEAFVFFVHSKNDIHNLTIRQIQSIYSGQATNWIQLGGKDQTIRAFQRPDNSGSQTMLQKLMEGKPLMIPPKEDVVAGMAGIIQEAASYKNYKTAIGYSFLFYATQMVKDKHIKILSVESVSPNQDTIRNGQYPLTYDFYAVTAGSNNANIQPFLQWILSDQGQSLVEKTGYTPIR